MANVKWGGNQDANTYQALNLLLHLINGNPGAPVEGQIWYDTAAKKLKFRTDSANIDPTARSSHSGTQLASTISDLAATVKAYRLDEFADATSPIQGVAGVAANDYVIKSQLEAYVLGTVYKAPVKAATTANISLTGNQTIDGIAVTSPDRVLVKDQTDPAQNGIYTVGTPWVRSTDADTTGELVSGTQVYVQSGSANGDKTFGLITDDTNIVIGTDAQNWAVTGGGAISYTAGDGLTLTGNDFDVNVGTGLAISSDQVVPDFSVVMRRKVALGFVGTTGPDITINHNFNLANMHDLFVKVYEVGVGEVLVGVAPQDVNNVVLSFGTTPTANQYRYAIEGLS